VRFMALIKVIKKILKIFINFKINIFAG